jgi:hypothetical protein
MTLESWLVRATKCLSAESRAMVRAEISDHYEASREEAIAGGAALYEAEAMALQTLGDPARANRLYRRSLLTSSEATLLSKGRSESRFICSRPILRNMFLALPGAAFLAGLIAFVMKANDLAGFLLPAALCLSVLLHGPFFPVYTPVRSRIYRGLKWTALSVLFALVMVVLGWQNSWLGVSCIWMVGWVEWNRFLIRRKLPINQWPRHLYL